jgi:hypothetical protein
VEKDLSPIQFGPFWGGLYMQKPWEKSRKNGAIFRSFFSFFYIYLLFLALMVAWLQNLVWNWKLLSIYTRVIWGRKGIFLFPSFCFPLLFLFSLSTMAVPLFWDYALILSLCYDSVPLFWDLVLMFL